MGRLPRYDPLPAACAAPWQAAANGDDSVSTASTGPGR
jgi:hypothetical protein